MRNVIRRTLLRRSGGDDRGAVAVMVGVLLGTGVLLGAGAIAIDVGQLYTERAELQSGAEAGALAVAKACAMQQSACDFLGGAEALADQYADLNAGPDGAAALDPDLITPVCGSIGSGMLPLCPSSSGELIDCPEPTGDNEYVDVHTATETASGETLLPPAFARALVNGADYDGTRVHACARAAWGGPSAADGLRLTMSWCEWNAATAGGTNYAPPPDELVDPSYERIIPLRQPGMGNPNNPPPTCEAGPSGYDIPGGFGWIDATDGDSQSCDAYVEEDGTYYPTPGGPVPGTCNDVFLDAYANYPKALILPIYVGHPTGEGNTGKYTMWQPAAFVVTGWKNLASMQSGNNNATSLLTGRTSCGQGGGSCIFGYFTTGVTSGELGGGEGAGVSVVKLTG